MSTFDVGVQDADDDTPPITSETMGARNQITVARLGRGDHEPLREPYLMPSVHYRNGNMERVDPAITQTPLGGMMPGPFAIPPAVVVGNDWHAPYPEEATEFDMGIEDAWPDGVPIPYGSLD